MKTDPHINEKTEFVLGKAIGAGFLHQPFVVNGLIGSALWIPTMIAIT